MIRRALVSTALLALCACAPDPEAAQSPDLAVRLADVYTPEMLLDPVEVVEPERSEWRPGEPAAGWIWRAAAGVAEAAAGESGLSGTAATPRPVVVFEAPEPLGGGDRLHAIEVRMRVSDGNTLRLTALGEEGPPAEAFAAPEGEGPPLAVSTPLLPGDEPSTYRIDLTQEMILGPFARRDPRRVVLRPTDAAGATFDIESVRLVFRREHLASVPSGLGWHGLDEIWRETLVSRPGETLRVPVRLPAARPVLDLAMGMPEDLPTRFEVALRPRGADESHPLIRRIVTQPDRWEEERVDLGEWAGEEVELLLTASADAPGAVALWGSPAVRARGAGPAAADSPAPQGVIVVIADTLRRDHLDAWGYDRETSPGLSRLAQEGVRFEDAVAQATWTKVSVPTILSGIYPTAHRVVSFEDRLPAAAVTLAEAFREAGYATLATSAWAFTGQLTNLHQGVEVLHEGGSVDLPDEASHTKTMRHFTDELLDFVERHREEPFLAVVHTGDPHSPYRPLGRYAEIWTEDGSDAWHAENLEKVLPLIEHDFFRNFELPTAADLARAEIPMERWRDHEIGWYDGSIRGMDAELERLVDRLDHLGLTDRVVIAFVSDHGEEFFEHGTNWHGLSLYGHQTDVPFLLWGPGFLPRGVTVPQPVGLVDLVPTLTSIAGLAQPATVQGRDLVPLIRATAAGEPPGEHGFRVEPVFSERTTVGVDAAGFPPTTVPTSWAVSTSDWRLIRNVDAGAGVPEYELYDRRRDPLGLTDVAGDNPQVVERLAETLAGWRAWVDENRLEAADTSDLSAEDLDRLRSLGYI